MDPMKAGGWRWDERLAEISSGLEGLTSIIQDSLGQLSTAELSRIFEWCAGARRELDRIEYAAQVALPLADLQGQVADHESAERIRSERERVARTKAARPEP